MSVFEAALVFTLLWEGGFVNNSRDPGGATNFGVSLRFLMGLPLAETDFDHDGTLTWRDVAAMDRADAADIYRRHFWAPMSCGQFPAGLGLSVFDGAVNMGTSRSGLFLQRAVNALWKKGALKEDGVIGPKTLRAVDYVVRKTRDGEGLTFVALRLRAEHYVKLGATPKYAWAYKGWMRRTEDLWSKALPGRPWPESWPTSEVAPRRAA